MRSLNTEYLIILSKTPKGAVSKREEVNITKLNDDIMRNIKNILIRNLTDQDREMLNQIMQETGYQQASKALMQIGYAFCRNRGLVARQAQLIRSLQKEVDFYKNNSRIICETVRKMEKELSKYDDGEKE